MVFKINVKDYKNDDFWICSITPAAITFKKGYAVFLFVILCCRDMQLARIQNMALPMYGTVFFAVFALTDKKK